MTRRRVIAKALLALGAAALATDVLAQQVFRGGTDLVLLHVTVVDTAGRFVGGLDRGAFMVFEDNVLQDISNFSRDPQPIAMAILLDTSISMEKKIAIAQQASVGLVRRLGPRDLAEVIAFATRPDVLQSFTGDRAALERAVGKAEVGGSTSLYNALYIALTELNETRVAAAREQRRQAIVVLSDGEDTSSLKSYEDVLELAKRSDVCVYAVGLRSGTDRPGRGYDASEHVLRTLSQETGGRAYFVTDVGQLQAIYQEIADELANQYTVGYTSKNIRRDGQWRRITVRVSRPGGTARAKSGYFGPKAGS